MDRSIKLVSGIIAFVIVLGIAYLVWSAQPAPSPEGGVIYFFYGEECPHCHDVMPFMINMTKKYPGADIRMLEVWHNQTNQEIYASVNAKLNKKAPGVPEVVIGDTVLVGSRDIPDQLERLIQERLKQ